jgi:hypothetical protein
VSTGSEILSAGERRYILSEFFTILGGEANSRQATAALDAKTACNCGGEPHGKYCALVLNRAVEYENHAAHFDYNQQ